MSITRICGLSRPLMSCHKGPRIRKRWSVVQLGEEIRLARLRSFPALTGLAGEGRDTRYTEYDPELLAPCGIYCGACRIYHATRDKDQKFLKKLVNAYEGKISGFEKPLDAGDIQCEGCLSENVSIFCRTCSVRDCTQERGYSGCHECDDFPCQSIKEIICSGFPGALH